MKDKVPQNAAKLIYSDKINDVKGPFREGILQPGDRIGGRWIVKRHVQNSCIYAVTKEGLKDQFALKIREEHNSRRFRGEISSLVALNSRGGHPSFQKLEDYSSDELWMVVSPLVRPEQSLATPLPSLEIDLKKFRMGLIDAVQFAISRGVFLSQDSQVYVLNSLPFFIDVEFGSRPRSINELKMMIAQRIQNGSGTQPFWMELLQHASVPYEELIKGFEPPPYDK